MQAEWLIRRLEVNIEVHLKTRNEKATKGLKKLLYKTENNESCEL